MDLGAKAKDAGIRLKAKAIDEHWPSIEHIWHEQIGPAAIAMARDDETITAAAQRIYPLLPAVLRIFIRERDFVTFCLANRDRLLVACEASDGTDTAGLCCSGRIR